ncbi:MAG: YdcF family protein [Devosia sp.]|nr:YdcF family protein [Devosia sp.]
MFAFDKYVTPFLTPLGLCLLLIAAALLLLALGRRGWAGAVLLVTLLGLYAASTPFVAGWLSGALEHQYPPQAIEATPTADAIVVLGGATGPALPPRQEPDLNEHADRLMHAADLYKAGKAPKIIASGGNWRHPSRQRSEAEDMRDVLMRFGVPSEAILMEGKSLDTGQNADFTAQLMQQDHLTTALLVTSGIHMPRAMAAFRRAGVSVTASATDIVDAGSIDWLPLDWLPSPMALVHTGDALHELVGMLYYSLRGWA